jgi:hypothetical protein
VQKRAELTEKLASLERRLFEKKSERRLNSKLPLPCPKPSALRTRPVRRARTTRPCAMLASKSRSRR